MTLTVRVLIGLVAGFLLGVALAGRTSPIAMSILSILTPVGTIFVNLIRMTVIPLVVSMLIATVGGTASRGLGRTGMRAVAISIALLTTAAVASVLVANPILARLSIDQSAAALSRQTLTPAAANAGGSAVSPTLPPW